jgi:hypothetical protein
LILLPYHGKTKDCSVIANANLVSVGGALIKNYQKTTFLSFSFYEKNIVVDGFFFILISTINIKYVTYFTKTLQCSDRALPRSPQA